MKRRLLKLVLFLLLGAIVNVAVAWVAVRRSFAIATVNVREDEVLDTAWHLHSVWLDSAN